MKTHGYNELAGIKPAKFSQLIDFAGNIFILV